jgi:hypothetical protein
MACARLDQSGSDRAEEPEPAPADGGHDQPVVRDEPGAPIMHRPLAESGFGRGMVIRLGQLGLHTTGDLAQADVGQLRAALGDISRLVDVEGWIQDARRDCGLATAQPALG